MPADPVFFRDLAYVFLAAVVGGALAWFARQPLILSYVVYLDVNDAMNQTLSRADVAYDQCAALRFMTMP